ncbi:MAG: CoA transferase [Planctomycetota bacterium]|nr:CoA transferase [Planctomycetota bacterium]
MDVIMSGAGEVRLSDVDAAREWMRDNKSRAPVDKVMSEHEAVARFVHDGDYVSYDLSSMVRGPMSLEREIVRQRRKNLWLAAKFTLLDSTLLVAGGCVSKIDVGFAGLGRTLFSAIETGKVQVIDWSNGTLALRHLAGAMGVPFLPTRALLGTDTFKHSGAKVVEDPFTGKKVCLVPAIHPNVAIIHVNQCDMFGNARIFGPSISPVETAMASKSVIVSTEEIITTEEIKKNPGRTTLPYYLVSAVVVAPHGAHPGTVPGLYTYDSGHLDEFFSARDDATMKKYLDKYVYGVKSHDEYLALIGKEKLQSLRENEMIREGYSA